MVGWERKGDMRRVARRMSKARNRPAASTPMPPPEPDRAKWRHVAVLPGGETALCGSKVTDPVDRVGLEDVCSACWSRYVE